MVMGRGKAKAYDKCASAHEKGSVCTSARVCTPAKQADLQAAAAAAAPPPSSSLSLSPAPLARAPAAVCGGSG